MSLPAFTSHTMDSGLDLELKTSGGSTVSEDYLLKIFTIFYLYGSSGRLSPYKASLKHPSN